MIRALIVRILSHVFESTTQRKKRSRSREILIQKAPLPFIVHSHSVSYGWFKRRCKSRLSFHRVLNTMERKSTKRPIPVICYFLFHAHRDTQGWRLSLLGSQIDLYFLESNARLLCKCKRSLYVACLSKFMYNHFIIVVAGYWAT